LFLPFPVFRRSPCARNGWSPTLFPPNPPLSRAGGPFCVKGFPLMVHTGNLSFPLSVLPFPAYAVPFCPSATVPFFCAREVLPADVGALNEAIFQSMMVRLVSHVLSYYFDFNFSGGAVIPSPLPPLSHYGVAFGSRESADPRFSKNTPNIVAPHSPVFFPGGGPPVSGDSFLSVFFVLFFSRLYFKKAEILHF